MKTSSIFKNNLLQQLLLHLAIPSTVLPGHLRTVAVQSEQYPQSTLQTRHLLLTKICLRWKVIIATTEVAVHQTGPPLHVKLVGIVVDLQQEPGHVQQGQATHVRVHPASAAATGIAVRLMMTVQSIGQRCRTSAPTANTTTLSPFHCQLVFQLLDQNGVLLGTRRWVEDYVVNRLNQIELNDEFDFVARWSMVP